MTIPVYPEDLPPYFLVDGFSYTFPDGRVKSQPDSGPPKMRRRTSAVVTPIAGAFDGSNNDFLRLRAFIDEECAGGALPFLIRDRMLDGNALTTETGAPLLSDTGEPLLMEEWWLALWDSLPTLGAQTGLIYRISFSLNVLP